MKTQANIEIPKQSRSSGEEEILSLLCESRGVAAVEGGGANETEPATQGQAVEGDSCHRSKSLTARVERVWERGCGRAERSRDLRKTLEVIT